MNRNQEIAVEMLDEIDRARSGSLSLSDLEYKLWRLLDGTQEGFPKTVAARVEDLVLEIQQKKNENIHGAGGAAADENLGVDAIYNEVASAIAGFIR